MTGSVISKSRVSPTCALAEETVRFRRRRTGVPSWSVRTWAVAAKTRIRVPARRMINLEDNCSTRVAKARHSNTYATCSNSGRPTMERFRYLVLERAGASRVCRATHPGILRWLILTQDFRKTEGNPESFDRFHGCG